MRPGRFHSSDAKAGMGKCEIIISLGLQLHNNRIGLEF